MQLRSRVGSLLLSLECEEVLSEINKAILDEGLRADEEGSSFFSHDLLDILLGKSNFSLFFTWALPALSFLGIQVSLYMVFLYVPDERVMGAVQRIFYFHVGSAFCTYALLISVFISSVVYLSTKKIVWDQIANSSVFVAFFFSSILLGTGMIWGHSAWNTWWRWEPRLVSSLVLWLFLLAYLVVRGFSKGEVSERGGAAVIGIVASLMVPIVIFSVRMLDQSQQLHPQVAANQGFTDPRYLQALLVASLSLICFSLWLCKLRLVQILMDERIEDIEIDYFRAKPKI